MTRKFFVGGNWKMNGSKTEIELLCKSLTDADIDPERLYWAYHPSTWITLGAVFRIVSPSQPKTATNARQELSPLIAEKVEHALLQGIRVIACVGETLADRETNRTEEVVFEQIKAMARKIKDWKRVVIAYEPVWAIGTGKTASPEQAEEVHSKLREWLSENVSPGVSESTRIIYGGSVTAANCKELGQQNNIDGFLVGGASLKPEFIQIINTKRTTAGLGNCPRLNFLN